MTDIKELAGLLSVFGFGCTSEFEIVGEADASQDSAADTYEMGDATADEIDLMDSVDIEDSGIDATDADMDVPDTEVVAPCTSYSKVGDDVRLTDFAQGAGASSLVWTGSRYAMGFKARTSTLDYGIYVGNISPAGTMPDPYARISNSDSPIHLSWSGSELGLGWLARNSDGGKGLNFQRVSAALVPIGSGVRVYDGEYPSISNLVWTGSEFAEVWADSVSAEGSHPLFLARISDTGELPSGVERVYGAGDDVHLPSLAWSGSEYGLFWRDMDSDLANSLYFQRLSADGHLLGAAEIVASGYVDISSAEAVWTGSEYGATFGVRDSATFVWEVRFARISEMGALIAVPAKVNEGTDSASAPSTAWNGEGFVVAWDDGGYDEDREIVFVQLSSEGERAGDEMRLTDAPGVSVAPMLAWSGSEYGIIWTDHRDDPDSGISQIYFSRLGCVE